jgi:HD domain
VQDILPPDTALAREAISLARDASSPALFHHCLRAYFWAKLLDTDTRSYDDEAVFVACMLHDLGLTEQYRLQGDQQQCFTSVGARVTQELAHRHAWPEPRMHVAASAITLHLNVIIGDEHGKEAQMVRAGSGGDVAGLGLDVLHRDQIDEVIGRYPRLNLKQEVVSALETEAIERPCCRTAFLCRRLSFTDLIKKNRVFRE